MNKQHVGKELIKKIENERGSKVIVYFTGDRHPISSIIAEDAVRPFYDHLINLEFDREERIIDLFLYSRGGDVSVPWRIASMLREFCDTFNVLIPYKAHSAATLLSLGADKIIMGKKAELGPIDPILSKKTIIDERTVQPQEVSVEDVNSFISFIRERANINDQIALAQIVESLINQISPLTLGSVNRQHSHIRLVARKLLTSRKERMDEEKINSIIETLTQKIYSHGHAIGRREARDIGLPVVFPNKDLEQLIWQLYLIYEEFLAFNDPIHPEIILEEKDQKILKDVPIAIIESTHKTHIFKVHIEARAHRNIPPSPQINCNVTLQLPPNITPNQLPQQTQQLLQQLMDQLARELPLLVQQEIIRQAPIVSIGVRTYGGKWHEVR